MKPELTKDEWQDRATYAVEREYSQYFGSRWRAYHDRQMGVVCVAECNPDHRDQDAREGDIDMICHRLADIDVFKIARAIAPPVGEEDAQLAMAILFRAGRAKLPAIRAIVDDVRRQALDRITAATASTT